MVYSSRTGMTGTSWEGDWGQTMLISAVLWDSCLDLQGRTKVGLDQKKSYSASLSFVVLTADIINGTSVSDRFWPSCDAF